MPKKQKVSATKTVEHAIYKDIRFPITTPGADYNSIWTATMTASQLYKIIASWESAVIFSAREGWVNATAPRCLRERCLDKNCKSYLYKRKASN